ncbi:hypothetical protein [Umezakia ovalisporum]|uniref:Uncharacterized protein n=2 Tax=Umezakia ovalisporum TaxID=75695 RepID=A0AA43GVC6_9CYAN|nr:hypothetical protein [Umezakia ovalisporum]MDH6055249.1 hypothetical protein [Umezakia ovalisporum FSS-43]MDH6062451.1 hypothetical protein [Umezakia ovalisporum FSS-62]MDH6067505.1 hypothetical protein [Umezakia ovalisporum APH033B]MDH6070008.1 hypothetical protein [Umezakia ovalisporum CobakiLakeA]MDH6073311.1 hypothetical protein [Umezakia ovalisporum CS-1034]
MTTQAATVTGQMSRFEERKILRPYPSYRCCGEEQLKRLPGHLRGVK